MERQDRYESVYVACTDMIPKLNVSDERTHPTSYELAESKALKAMIRDLAKTNDILKAATIFFPKRAGSSGH